jgi:hypothetical protein
MTLYLILRDWIDIDKLNYNLLCINPNSIAFSLKDNIIKSILSGFSFTPFYISNADFYVVLNHIKIIYSSSLFFGTYFSGLS